MNNLPFQNNFYLFNYKLNKSIKSKMGCINSRSISLVNKSKMSLRISCNDEDNSLNYNIIRINNNDMFKLDINQNTTKLTLTTLSYPIKQTEHIVKCGYKYRITSIDKLDQSNWFGNFDNS